MITMPSMLGLVAVASASASGTAIEAIPARGQLVVAMKNEGAASPAAHRDPAHFQKRNFELEIARRIAQRILGDEKKLVVTTLPGRERLAALENGRVDAVISMIRIDERTKALADLSEPYYESGFAVVLPAESGVTKFEELAGKRIALPKQHLNDPRARVDAIPRRAATSISWRAGGGLPCALIERAAHTAVRPPALGRRRTTAFSRKRRIDGS